MLSNNKTGKVLSSRKPGVSKKAIIGILLSASMTACGIHVHDSDMEDSEPVPENHLMFTAQSTKDLNTLDADSRQLKCRRMVEGRILRLEFQGGEAGDGRLGILLAGKLDEGMALTPDNSSMDRFFEISLERSDGRYYSFSSENGASQEGGAYGALTITEVGKYHLAGRIFIRGMPESVMGSAYGPDSREPADQLEFKGSFSCRNFNEG